MWESRDEKILRFFFGNDISLSEDINRQAPYSIYLSQEFVKKTQYKPSNDPTIKDLVEYESKNNNLKIHLVYACPQGHLTYATGCGVPTKITKCIECDFYVGGVHHLVVPGSYIVYHDGYVDAHVWYGTFPIYSKQIYLKLVEQYNIAAQGVGLPEIEVIDKDPAIARRIIEDRDEIRIPDDATCNACDEPLNRRNDYYLPDCGHIICEECLRNARGGNLENINDPDDENMKFRQCVTCNKRYRFGGGLRRYRITRHVSDKSCIIS